MPDAPYEGGVEKGSPLRFAVKIMVAFIIYYKVPYTIGKADEINVY